MLFVELLFDGGAVRLHSALGPLTVGGNTYTGTGRLGQVSAAEEDSELARTPVTLTLAGLPTDLLAVVLGEDFGGRRATLSLGYLDPVTMQLVADPFVLYRGRMDTVSVEQGDTLSISVAVESRFAAWDRPKERRFNDADQQGRHPGDRFFEFAEQATEKELQWGR